MTDTRIERDTLGEVRVPADRLWGAQTQRALEHFRISTERMPVELVRALVLVKRVAAEVNRELGELEPKIAEAIVAAADEALAGRHDGEFPLPVWQTGSGTQTNMNANEVLANRASELLGGPRGEGRLVHPNDHVNRSQSSNDVFPTAMHVAACGLLAREVVPALRTLSASLAAKSAAFAGIIKVGRTHLQDATPVTLGQEFSGYATQVGQAADAVEASLPGVAAHGTLRTAAVALAKVANDIRWLGSGPRCGIGELRLPENEPGSSIMPGKVNPTQSEAVLMLAAQVLGNDVTVGIAGASGSFELNVAKPVIAHCVLQSARLIADGARSFERYCVAGIEPDRTRIAELLEHSLMLVTALAPRIGYDKAARVARKAHQESLTLRESALALGYVTAAEFDEWVRPGDMI